jgi:CHAT domain-containing protein
LLSGNPLENVPPSHQHTTGEELQAAITREEEFLAQHSSLVAQELAQRQVTVEMLAGRLPTDSALVEFVRIRDKDEKKKDWSDTSRYLAFILTLDNRTTLVDLGEATKIDSTIKNVLAAINDPDFRRNLGSYAHQTDTKLTELYNLLFLPLQDILGSRTRLFVSPDGELSKVPFAALRTPDGHYLVEQLAVSFVSSGRDLLRDESGEDTTMDLLLVANPAFDNREVSQRMALSEDAVRADDYAERFEPLPGTAEEAQLIPPFLTGMKQVLQGKEATESAVRSIKSPKVLHLATHGFFLKDEEPLLPEDLTLAEVLSNV